MLPLSLVYSSDKQACAWSWEVVHDGEGSGSLEGALSSHEHRTTRGHIDWLSVTQCAPERGGIKKGRPEQCTAEHFKD